MARVSLYLPDKEIAKLKKLKRICEKNKSSLSEWFLRSMIRELEAIK